MANTANILCVETGRYMQLLDASGKARAAQSNLRQTTTWHALYDWIIFYLREHVEQELNDKALVDFVDFVLWRKSNDEYWRLTDDETKIGGNFLGFTFNNNRTFLQRR